MIFVLYELSAKFWSVARFQVFPSVSDYKLCSCVFFVTPNLCYIAVVAFSRVGSISSPISLAFAAKLLSAVSLSPATMSGVSVCDLTRKRKQNVVEAPDKKSYLCDCSKES